MSERKRFLLRISPELWEDLQSMAAQEFRSVNGQIEYLLRQAVRQRDRGRRSGDDPEDSSAEEPTGGGVDPPPTGATTGG